ncbi:MAG: protein serine/threonine phosphatase [Bacteroidota bacterium]|jgi:serine phosphatase RsbU (regulator of sigma subunit)|nr:protein serine/threonine phosphatase [Bacteroidota bacterium]
MKSFLMIVFFSLAATVFSQDPYLDSLNNQLKQATHDSARCHFLINIAEYLYGSNLDTVIPMSEKVIALADANLGRASAIEKKSFLKSKAVSLNNIGAIQADKGRLSKAIEFYEASLEVHRENLYKTGISEALNNLGIVYDNLGDAPKALEYFHEALKIQEELHLKDGQALTLNNIAYIYASQKEYKKALEYNNRSLKYRYEIDDKEGITQSLNNIANIYETIGNPDCKNGNELCLNEGLALALKNYKLCIQIQSEAGDKRGMAYSLNNIASFYRKHGDPDFSGTATEKKKHGQELAMEYLSQSLQIHEEIQNNVGVAYASNNIAQVLLNDGKTDDAMRYAKQSFDLGQKFGHPEIIYRSASTLKKIYLLQSKFKEAFHMQELEVQMRDSLNNLSNQKALITQNTKYEYEKKAAADSVRVYEERKVLSAQLKQEKTQRLALYCGIILVAIFGAFMYNRFKITQKQNALISQQKEELQVQKELVEAHQKETLDSIHYAKRIQTALITNADVIAESIPDNFILFQPKDIVSGDFYWATHYNGRFYLAVCDSTGHGVPGAFMSLLNMGFLSEAIKEKNIAEPHEIFNYVRDRLITTISDGGQKDGMDGILICIDNDHSGYPKRVTYAAANNEPILIRGEEIIELPKDKMPVGKGESTDSFICHSVDLQKGDTLYLYTDGYADQFGGEKGKKFKYRKLNELLREVQKIPMFDQRLRLEAEFASWKGELEQVDDVLVTGIKF